MCTEHQCWCTCYNTAGYGDSYVIKYSSNVDDIYLGRSGNINWSHANRSVVWPNQWITTTLLLLRNDCKLWSISANLDKPAGLPGCTILRYYL